ncbi:hypothetical protein [Flavobacterium sp. N1719]|uniref:hypothetical protein n=1 Tax=Flavobacterium sp. N1719 TaxID=2885633 RepID=UPI002222A87C|nr:hypothetical protein [Flavobacterium sp. N1719]
MNKILKKIPTIVYGGLLILLSIYLTHRLEEYLIYIKWISKTEGEARVALYSSVLTVLGILYGVLQLQQQRKDSLFANEYMNQPEFEFLEFSSDEKLSEHKSPGCCCVREQVCTNNCIDEHWFNLKQIGNLPATDIKISMFHKSDSQNVCCDTRIKKVETLNKNGVYQYKLPPYTFPERFFDETSNGSFYVLLSYKSLYSKLKYKRIYELEYSPKENAELNDGLWGNNIKFFCVELTKITDYQSLSMKEIIIGKLIHLLFKIKIKDTFNKENWILKY